MAEGFTRHLHPDKIEAYSAGIIAKGVDPYAILVMREIGIDISGQHSKTIDEVAGIEFDYVITLCSEAGENCPLYPAKTKIIHCQFDDPPKLAENETNKEKKINHYRKVRDEIRKYIENLPKSLN